MGYETTDFDGNRTIITEPREAKTKPQRAVENLKEAWRLLNKVYPDVKGIFNQRDYDELKEVQGILLFKCQLINQKEKQDVQTLISETKNQPENH